MYIFEKTFGGEYIWGLGPAPPIPPNEFPPPPNVLTLQYLFLLLIFTPHKLIQYLNFVTSISIHAFSSI